MPVIDTSTLRQNDINSDTEFVYNGLDACLTLEIFEEISSLYNAPPDIYSFSRALQAPVLEMMCRGFRVDEYERQAAIRDIRQLIGTLERQLQVLAFAVWDKELNPRSPKQLLEFFYGRMKLPEIWTSQKGVRKLSMNMETLEKLEVYLHARPIIAHIMRVRELSKMLSVLETEIDADFRMRTSYNIGGTESGRFSSSANAFGTGCCLPSAEALTRVGWKRLDTIADGTEIAQYDKGIISFVPCTMYSTQDAGHLLNIKSEQFNLTMTEQHRMLHFSVEGGHSYTVPAKEREYKAVTYLPLGGSLQSGTVEYPAYLAMLMADWSKDEYQWRAAFKKKRKVDRFLQLAEKFSIPFREGNTAREGYSRFSILYQDVPKEWPKKWGSWILDLTPKCRSALLEEARHWDSHDRGSGFIFYSAEKEQAEWFATLAHLCGRGATVRRMEQSEAAYSDTVMWAVNVKNKGYCSIQNKHWSRIQYDGKVYCPQVPSSYWLVRDTGFISVTGNTNLQNLRQDPDWRQDDGKYKVSLRKIFIADPGMKICGIDLEQAESREVGWQLGVLFDDWTYLDACEAGDLHTKTCQLIWDNLGWTGDPKADRKLADQNFYRQFSYRDMSKRGGHGSNYLGTPFTMARHLKVPTKLMEHFQAAYFRAYPIPRWHTWTAGQIQTIQQLTTPFGRRRHFFGRPNDDTTLREAVAYVPQSATADRMNLALWRIWYYMPQVQLLAQVHDAVYFQFPENLDPSSIITEALTHLKTEIKHTRPNGQTRIFDVPGEAKVGWNWGNYHEKHNPDGLQKWKGQDERKRSGSGLQRVM